MLLCILLLDKIKLSINYFIGSFFVWCGTTKEKFERIMYLMGDCFFVIYTKEILTLNSEDNWIVMSYIL